jgi:hypothetical protein
MQGALTFGDVVQIGGKDRFFLIIQDISIEKNSTAKDLKANYRMVIFAVLNWRNVRFAMPMAL